MPSTANPEPCEFVESAALKHLARRLQEEFAVATSSETQLSGTRVTSQEVNRVCTREKARQELLGSSWGPGGRGFKSCRSPVVSCDQRTGPALGSRKEVAEGRMIRVAAGEDRARGVPLTWRKAGDAQWQSLAVIVHRSNVAASEPPG
jgi:hypothetical protein